MCDSYGSWKLLAIRSNAIFFAGIIFVWALSGRLVVPIMRYVHDNVFSRYNYTCRTGTFA
jgi:hypothetical protein